MTQRVPNLLIKSVKYRKNSVLSSIFITPADYVITTVIITNTKHSDERIELFSPHRFELF